MKEFEYKPIGAQIEKFVPEKDLTSAAQLYAEVFAGPPWNEHTRCPNCSNFFGLESKPGLSCGNCGKELTLAYPTNETEQYILDQINRKDALAFVMKKQGDLIGFVWGFLYELPYDFTKEKYRTPRMQNGIKSLLEENKIVDTFFYFSECGVKTDQRGNKFSNILSEILLNDARRIKLPVVLRTNCASPMVAVAKRFGMTQIMGPCVNVDTINMKIIKTNEAVNNFTDSEIEERVLFMLQ